MGWNFALELWDVRGVSALRLTGMRSAWFLAQSASFSVAGCISLLLFLQVSFCDLRILVDNRCLVDTQEENGMKVFIDKTQAFALSEATACMHEPQLESLPPQDKLHTSLGGSQSRVGAQGPGLGLIALGLGSKLWLGL